MSLDEHEEYIIMHSFLYGYTAKFAIFDWFHNITIQVDDWFGFSTPHINVYNSKAGGYRATKIATLSLLTDEIFYIDQGHFDQWKLTERQIRMIRRILRWGHPLWKFRYNYWQMACIAWNRILDGENIIKLPINWDTMYVFDRKFDEVYSKDQPLYIPSTQPIPKWHY